MTAKKSTEEFIQDANNVHNNLYTYEKAVYLKAIKKVIITCKKHGDFLQAPCYHTNSKQGCPKCGVEQSHKQTRSTTEKFMLAAHKIHNNKYDYSLVDYKRRDKKVSIVCPIHGRFSQTPYTHLNGSGCIQCGYESNKIGHDLFVERSSVVHNNKYNYSLVDYHRIDKKVSIICPIHGEFKQVPSSHMTGIGCKECSMIERVGGYSDKYFTLHPIIANQTGVLYVAEIYNNVERFVKIGITSTNTIRRFSGHIYPYNYYIIKEYNLPMIVAFKVEQELLEIYKQYQYTPLILFKGWTECLHLQMKDQLLDNIQNMIV